MGIPSGTGGRGRVIAQPTLVIESDFFMQGELRSLLEEIGLEVQLSPTAEEAIPRAREATFSLAILDPKGIGASDVHLACHLRERNDTIPLILLSPPSDLLKVSDPGPLSRAIHVPKPLRRSQIRGVILEALGLSDTDQPGTTIPR